MLPSRENILLSSKSSFKSIYKISKSFEAFWHFHPEYEITLITRGQGRRIIGDDMSHYNNPDLIFLSPNTPHTWISENEHGPQKALVLQFHQDCLGNGFFSGIDLNELSVLLNGSWAFPSETAKSAEKIMRTIHQSVGLKRVISLLELLNLLNNSERHAISQIDQLKAVNEKAQKQINFIINHFLKNEFSSVPQLANELAMSESTFRRFFKKNTGRSIIDFRNEMRINTACLLLQKNKLSISEVANQAGFNNLSHFNRQFLRWKKCKPKEYGN